MVRDPVVKSKSQDVRYIEAEQDRKQGAHLTPERTLLLLVYRQLAERLNQNYD